MNKDDIDQIIKAIEDYILDSELDYFYWEMKTIPKMKVEIDIESKARSLGVTSEYYMNEFML